MFCLIAVNNLVPTKTGSSLTEMTTQGIHSSLTEVSQGIQTPEGINLNNGGEYNMGSTNSLMLNGADNQSEEHGASLGGGMNIRKEGHGIENQKFLNNINQDDGIPEDDFVFINNKGGILDMMEAFVDMQLDEELNNKVCVSSKIRLFSIISCFQWFLVNKNLETFEKIIKRNKRGDLQFC